MNLRAFFKDAGKAASKKSPVILTTLAVTGTITTAYLAAKAAYKSVSVLEDAKEEKTAEFLGEAIREIEDGPEPQTIREVAPPPFTPHDAFMVTWKLYVPAAISATITVVAIISVDRVGESRTAAFAAAYSVSDRMYREYQKKVTDKIGKNKEQQIRDELAEEGVARDAEIPDVIVKGRKRNKNPIIASRAPARGQVYCKDSWSGRYFPSDQESLRKAVNDFNEKVLHDSFASLSDFWHLIGLEPTMGSDDLGWSTDELLDLGYSHTTYAGDPCIVIEYRTSPSSRFQDFH